MTNPRNGSLAALSVVAAAMMFAPACLHAQQTAWGSIQGHVVDADNAPVAGATVYAAQGPTGTGVNHGVIADGDGRFFLDQVVPGTYQLSAFKTQDGYPDTAEPFYAQPDHPLTQVTVAAATESADLSIALGQRCARLHITVADAENNAPITSAAIELRRANPSGHSMQGQKSFPLDLLVPAGDVTLQIAEPGYQPWHFAEDGRDALTLKPGEQRMLHVRLQPLAVPK